MSNNIRTNLFTISIWVTIFKGKIQPWIYSQQQYFTLALKDIAEEELNKLRYITTLHFANV